MNETVAIRGDLKTSADKVTRNLRDKPDVNKTLDARLATITVSFAVCHRLGRAKPFFSSLARRNNKLFSLTADDDDKQQFVLMKANSRGKQCKALYSIMM